MLRSRASNRDLDPSAVNAASRRSSGAQRTIAAIPRLKDKLARLRCTKARDRALIDPHFRRWAGSVLTGTGGKRLDPNCHPKQTRPEGA